MAYKPSAASRRMYKRFESQGKQRSLIPPRYRPPIQRLVDVLCLLALPFAVYVGYLWGWPAAGATVFGTIVLWTVRELFLQDDHALVRIYGPFGRLRFVFEKVLQCCPMKYNI